MRKSAIPIAIGTAGKMKWKEFMEVDCLKVIHVFILLPLNF
jgi:hypothetical protein